MRKTAPIGATMKKIKTQNIAAALSMGRRLGRKTALRKVTILQAFQKMMLGKL